MGFDMLRIDGKHCLMVDDRLLRPAEHIESGAETVTGVHVAGVARNNVLEMTNSFVRTIKLQQRVAECDVRFRIVRPQRQGSLESDNRLLLVVKRAKNVAENSCALRHNWAVAPAPAGNT